MSQFPYAKKVELDYATDEKVVFNFFNTVYAWMAVGIAVRLRDVPGNPPGLAVAKRYGFDIALSVVGVVPLVGTLAGFVALINYLWPLWDDKKQALHDKVAATNVVRVR